MTGKIEVIPMEELQKHLKSYVCQKQTSYDQGSHNGRTCCLLGSTVHNMSRCQRSYPVIYFYWLCNITDNTTILTFECMYLECLRMEKQLSVKVNFRIIQGPLLRICAEKLITSAYHCTPLCFVQIFHIMCHSNPPCAKNGVVEPKKLFRDRMTK